jgi:hypothetical protein
VFTFYNVLFLQRQQVLDCPKQLTASFLLTEGTFPDLKSPEGDIRKRLLTYCSGGLNKLPAIASKTKAR